LRNDLIIEDTTLRDGEQTPGVAFSKETKLNIYDHLVAAGVRWIEVGIPAMGGEELATLKAILERTTEATKVIAWNRGLREDVEGSINLGFSAVHIGLPTSNMHLRNSLRRDTDWLFQQARDLIKYAKDRGAFVSISAEDVGRTEIPLLQDYACIVQEAGADRLRLSDTIGILASHAYAERVAAVKKVSMIDLQCHTHNDFGLALANTLAGLEAGARYFHVTVNGIGERAGMPDLAQTALALRHLYNIDVGVITERLYELSRLVATAVRHPVLPWQPVVGENVFAHESGIHANAMLRNAETFEPFGPEEVGGRRRYVVGKHSGRALLHAVLLEHGAEVDVHYLDRCLELVRAAAIRNNGAVSPDELLAIYQGIVRHG
jgi:homocitrate synthase NifV